MRKPGWWPVRKSKARQLADEAEAARDRTHREVAEPLRQMRQGDFLTPAIVRGHREAAPLRRRLSTQGVNRGWTRRRPR